MMDLNDLRAITTVLLFLIFIGVTWWAFGRNRRDYFEAAALVPFSEEDELGQPDGKPASHLEKRKKS